MALSISDRGCTCVQAVSVTIFIILVCGLMTLPTVFYAVPPPGGSTNANPPVNSTVPVLNVISGNCSATEYTGSVCRDILLGYQSCIPGRADSSAVYISKGDTQTDREASAQTIISLLQDGANQDCATVAVPLLCLFFFGLCDESGNEYLPSRSECEHASINVCPTEWQLAMSAFDDLIPQCEHLRIPETTVECSTTTVLRKQERRRQAALTCSEDFYFDVNTSTCLAECGEWSPYPDHVTRVADAFIILFCSLGILATIGILILTCVQHDRVLKFPTVFVIYTSLTVSLLSIVLLIGYTNRKELFCISRNLVDINFKEFSARIAGPTPFCTFVGVVASYVLLQLAFWWVCHTASVFWGVIFPFHFKKTITSGRIKFVQIIITIIGVAVPCVPFIATLSTEGFTDGMIFPPICSPVDISITYYTLVLPISIMVALGLSLMAVVLSTIIKAGCITMKISSSTSKTRTAEIKVFILLCYFAMLALVYLSCYCFLFWRVDQYVAEVSSYFICELGGVQSAGVSGCDRSGFQSTVFPALFTVGIGLMVLFPVSNLIYIINIEGVKAVCRKAKMVSRDKHTSSPLDTPDSMSLSNSQTHQLAKPVTQLSLVTSVSPSVGMATTDTGTATIIIHEDGLDHEYTRV